MEITSYLPCFSYARHMRCNWFTTARTVNWRCTQYYAPQSTSPRAAFRTLLRQPTIHRHQFKPLSNAAYVTAPSLTAEPSVLNPPVFHAPLTAAQISRAACRAVHLSLQRPIGGVEDAYLIVNSLRYSSFHSDPSAQLNGPAKDFANIAISFARPVSSRLASHALLHGLLRIGHTADASRLALLMMEAGLRLRSKTIKAAINGLLPRSPRTGSIPINYTGPSNFISNRSINNLIPLTQNQNTRLALQLLSLATKTRHRRDNGMFATLICFCLINGEIILASLLFGFFANECQLRHKIADQLKSSCPDVGEEPPTDKLLRAKQDYQRLSLEGLKPNPILMQSILSSIDDAIKNGGESEEGHPSLSLALQALANLAVLLDHRQIPFGEIGPLIRALYSCPRTDSKVWITSDGGRRERVPAYSYFRNVLQRLIEDLPTRTPRSNALDSHLIATHPPPKPYKNSQRQLDLHAYNSLLHYSLRHHLSPDHAGTILYHMMSERKPPLRPDIVTYNILLRSGTLLRRNDIALKALKDLRTCFGGQNRTAITKHTPPATVKPSEFPITLSNKIGESKRHPETSQLVPAPRSIVVKSSKLSTALHAKAGGTTEHLETLEFVLQLDPYSLSSYFVYLTSTGQGHLVIDLTYEIFPELRPIPPITRASTNPIVLYEMYKQRRDACLTRAILLGPYLFTTILNALRKSGATGIAKSVWQLAKQAERKSWDPALDVKPWCLPVHAYTTMVQCYAMEAKHPSLNRLSRLPSVRRVREKARRDGVAIYRFMRRRAKELHALSPQTTQLKTIEIPLPDSRFFNAALDLFSEPLRPRRFRRYMAHYRHNFRQARWHHSRQGTTSNYWHPKLREIAKGMFKAGFAVPPVLRHLFLGRWDAGTWHIDPPQLLKRRPFAYPNPMKPFTPYSLPTTKDRGLPLRRIRKSRNRTSVKIM